MTYVQFATPGKDQAAVVSHFKSTLDGWTPVREKSFKTRMSATFVRGNAWLWVSASNTSADGQPGYVVVVDALDANVLVGTVIG
jgi:hypothetical protein